MPMPETTRLAWTVQVEGNLLIASILSYFDERKRDSNAQFELVKK
jgi:hypothetical protein